MPGSVTTASLSILRFAVLGDVEPKPEPIFDNFRKAVHAVNQLAEDPGIDGRHGIDDLGGLDGFGSIGGIDFTVCIGDLAHKGKTEQYEIVTDILAGLKTPVYAIMGNEELCQSVDRFLEYAARWNDGVDGLPGISYVKEGAGYTFVFATAVNDGRTFTTEEIAWIERQVDQRSDSPVILFTHAPAPGLFPVPAERAMANELFERVTARPNVIAVFSGHIHLDLDAAASYAQDAHGVHHIHVPGIERTKVGPTHTPRFRVVTLFDDARVLVQTYNVALEQFEERHQIHFRVSVPKTSE